MYPPVGGGQMTMSQSRDITLANRLVIPAGTAIWVPHHAIQNVSFNWDQPNTFMPGDLPPKFLFGVRQASWLLLNVFAAAVANKHSVTDDSSHGMK